MEHLVTTAQKLISLHTERLHQKTGCTKYTPGFLGKNRYTYTEGRLESPCLILLTMAEIEVFIVKEAVI